MPAYTILVLLFFFYYYYLFCLYLATGPDVKIAELRGHGLELYTNRNGKRKHKTTSCSICACGRPDSVPKRAQKQQQLDAVQ